MKKYIKLIGISAALVLAGSAHANGSFSEGSRSSTTSTTFTDYITVTPAAIDVLTLNVSGYSSVFSALSFKFLSVPGLAESGTLKPSPSGDNIAASFNDHLNKFGDNTAANFSLTKGQSYLVEIQGTIKSGQTGLVNWTVSGGTAVAAVPEPESYAMFLAGLGLMGAIAKRRKSKQA